ncbi:MAG: aspartate--tRNA ligase [Firmicutes bacterium]|nr:aspartate--tRNA ligase [Candidatus Alectryobacillus merdavium]
MKAINRTYYNGEISLKNLNEEVYLIGWVNKVRDLGSLTFIDLRDRSGIVQLILKNDSNSFESVKNEYLIHVKGVVRKKDVPNPKLKTGEIEIEVSELSIINTSENTPFIIDDETDALEDTRLKYRYLDLRRPIMQNYIKLRAKLVSCVHDYLDKNGFLEIETPVLGVSTPEGAREFLVPSRVNKGQFYALPQSPQLYKQLLMISGFERYYQIAKCFRDEDLRADRQPEFTQIDIETSFLNQEQLLSMMEELLHKIFKETINYDLKLPLRQMEYDEAVNIYGSDKPDTRFGLKLVDIKSLFSRSLFETFQNSKYVKGFVVSNKADIFTRKFIDSINLTANKFGMKNYFILKNIGGKLNGSVAKFFDEELEKEVISTLGLNENDVLVVAASNIKYNVNFGLGAIRNDFGHRFNLIDESKYDALWVVHWPLFSYDEVSKELSPEHHPFTRPCDEDLDKLDKHPEDVYAYCYDIVINGYEAGGGSLRIYDQKIQKKIFELLGLSDEDIKNRFGFFIEAFKYGTPPHAGIAFGLERLVMLLTKTDNIRDTIAFPKNLKARDPMSNAPSFVNEKQLNDLNIKLNVEDEKGE